MKFKQISIMSLLLVTALIAVSIGLIFEKQKNQLLLDQAGRLKRDAGFIDVEDPSLIHIRELHSEEDSWEFQVFLPADHGLQFELLLGDPENPEVLADLGDPPEGQFKMTIFVANSIVKPNRTEVQCFVVGCVGDHTDPNSITRHGESWRRSVTEKYREPIGNYDNKAHHTSLRHDTNVSTYGTEEEVPVLLVFDQSEVAKKVPEEQRDRIGIRLKQRE